LDADELHAALIADGVPADVVDGASGSEWSNGPGDRYAAHRHDYDKALVCLSGSITFELVDSGRSVTLRAGERLDLPAGARHGAVVGPSGVRCHETHLPAGTLVRHSTSDHAPLDPLDIENDHR
jgi:quercetin dioxygenase-like cupin family protein